MFDSLDGPSELCDSPGQCNPHRPMLQNLSPGCSLIELGPIKSEASWGFHANIPKITETLLGQGTAWVHTDGRLDVQGHVYSKVILWTVLKELVASSEALCGQIGIGNLSYLTIPFICFAHPYPKQVTGSGNCAGEGNAKQKSQNQENTKSDQKRSQKAFISWPTVPATTQTLPRSQIPCALIVLKK